MKQQILGMKVNGTNSILMALGNNKAIKELMKDSLKKEKSMVLENLLGIMGWVMKETSTKDVFMGMDFLKIKRKNTLTKEIIVKTWNMA